MHRQSETLPLPLPAAGPFELRVTGAYPAVFTLDTLAAGGYILGRSGVGSDYVPDVDFARCNAHEHGVSRRHAALVCLQDTLHLLDLESVNGTFVNGKRLRPDAPQPLRAGDTLVLGTLNFTLTQIN
jgi:pSer/pThr/pTyr-binding forkhead associated (FHA) protein